MLRKIGMRAHDYGKTSIEELVNNIAGDGYTTIQLALKKALVDVNDFDDGLTTDYAKHIERTLYNQSIDISVLGVYLNYASLDIFTRENNINIFIKHLLLAKEFGARLVGTETGSLDVNYKFHEKDHSDEGFYTLKNSLDIMSDKAKVYNVNIGIEPVSNHILYSAKTTKKMLTSLNNSHVKVIFDPVNIITPSNYKNQEYIIKEMFELVGDSIQVVHGKDFIIDGGKKIVVSPGKGWLDFKLLTDLIKQSPNEIDLLAENNLRHELHQINNYFKSLFE